MPLNVFGLKDIPKCFIQRTIENNTFNNVVNFDELTKELNSLPFIKKCVINSNSQLNIVEGLKNRLSLSMRNGVDNSHSLNLQFRPSKFTNLSVNGIYDNYPSISLEFQKHFLNKKDNQVNFGVKYHHRSIYLNENETNELIENNISGKSVFVDYLVANNFKTSLKLLKQHTSDDFQMDREESNVVSLNFSKYFAKNHAMNFTIESNLNNIFKPYVKCEMNGSLRKSLFKDLFSAKINYSANSSFGNNINDLQKFQIFNDDFPIGFGEIILKNNQIIQSFKHKYFARFHVSGPKIKIPEQKNLKKFNFLKSVSLSQLISLDGLFLLDNSLIKFKKSVGGGVVVQIGNFEMLFGSAFPIDGNKIIKKGKFYWDIDFTI
eukprot:TRINITY_DN3428_c0_g1_i1.p1 TRINITY_DN3428_c0_g1~~TRINITY_DN3428_c0_g1_i1.p1  ORF type:complete len:377 (-),score=120.71 TRINITY_DN3428_c0_g1_i1:6-1136(-)